MPVFKPKIEYLIKSINSILNQTYDEIELLVIVDPVEGNVEVQDQLIWCMNNYKDDPRLRVIFNKRRIGFTNSLNLGLKKSKGAYIARMDSDDISLPTRFQEEMTFLLKRKYDIVGCWSYIINEFDKIMGILTPPCTWRDIRKFLLLHNPFIHSSILFTRKVLKVVGFYDPSFEPSEDYEFYLRIFSCGFKGRNIPKLLHQWRLTEDSITGGKLWKLNRIAYLRSKCKAVFKYGFNRFTDIILLSISLPALFTPPSLVLPVKSFLRLCSIK